MVRSIIMLELIFSQNFLECVLGLCKTTDTIGKKRYTSNVIASQSCSDQNIISHAILFLSSSRHVS